jgi:predicted component of type VI protein secretion system
MFLEKKFAFRGKSEFTPRRCVVLPAADFCLLPEVVYDVISNLQILLLARRNYDHVALDFGFFPIHGRTGLSDQLERLQKEIPDVFARYERRFTLATLEAEVDDDGLPYLLGAGSIRGQKGALSFSISIKTRKITRVEFEP